MMSNFSLDQTLSPEWYAKCLIQDLNINKPPIIAKDIAERLKIKFVEEDLDNQKVDGALYRKNGNTLIVINSQIDYKERKNFSGAHEIGHFSIPSHNLESYSCSKSDMEVFGSLSKAVEAEANRFAAALLMPQKLIVSIINKKTFSFEAIQDIAESFMVSLSAAALRFIEFTGERCAVFFSRNGQIVWSKGSRRFRYSLRRGKLLDKTYAYDSFFGNEPLPNKFEQVYPYAWITDQDVPDSLKVQEFSIYFNNINSVLSFVKIDEDEENEDENEDW